ncbi:MAG: family 16 glycosylhydrolase [Athalassotoga sp.]|uniref:family 16 glycosylhydrolase n=1 Tax=Athalassotoga sp. TaxID=2022597 RepID=UPI003D07A0A4
MKKYFVFFTIFLAFSAFFAFGQNIIGNGDFTKPLYVPSSIPPDGNIFTNHNWSFLVNATGGGTATSGNGYFEATLYNAGSNSWAEQLLQSPITLEHGYIYKFSFTAKSSISRNVEVKIGGTAPLGWPAYNPGNGMAGGMTFQLGNEWKTYEATFTMYRDTDEHARFEFELGLASGTIWIKNVSLEKVGQMESKEETQVSTSILTDVKGWNLIFDEDFSSATSINKNIWNFDIGNGEAQGIKGWGNNELEYYTDHNVYIQNGNLVIEADKEKVSDQYGTYDYTSARINTMGKFSFEYGKVVIEAKLPEGQGIWPAFWMLGDNINQVGWPACGEIDIMEMLGNNPAKVYGTAHGPISGGVGIGKSYVLPSGTFSDSYHTFTFIWNKEAMGWYVDGHLYFFLTKSYVESHYGSQDWVYDHPFFLIINLAVGGNWPGNPDSSTVFPQKMYIKSIKVYQTQN